MKTLKLLATLLGVVAIITGMSSCEKDKDDSNECCTYSYTDGGVTYTYKACEDGTVVYTTSEGVRETYSWKDEYDSWAEVKTYFLEEVDGTCN